MISSGRMSSYLALLLFLRPTMTRLPPTIVVVPSPSVQPATTAPSSTTGQNATPDISTSDAPVVLPANIPNEGTPNEPTATEIDGPAVNTTIAPESILTNGHATAAPALLLIVKRATASCHHAQPVTAIVV